MTCGHIEHKTDTCLAYTCRTRCELTGTAKLDVAHTLTTNARKSHLYTTAVADNTLVLDTLVLTTSTLPVTSRTEDTLTEETALFRFESTVVNCFRILHLTFCSRTTDNFRS